MTNLLETERLIIRSWMPELDAEQAFAIYGDPEVTRFIGGKTENNIDTQREKLTKVTQRYQKLNNGTGFWALVEKQSKEIIVGAILLKRLPDKNHQSSEDYEVGWHLQRNFWGKGYATEAAREIINYGFNVLNLLRIYSVVHPENYASVRVTQRLGMKPMGYTNKYYGGVEVLLFQIDSPKYNG